MEADSVSVVAEMQVRMEGHLVTFTYSSRLSQIQGFVLKGLIYIRMQPYLTSIHSLADP